MFANVSAKQCLATARLVRQLLCRFLGCTPLHPSNKLGLSWEHGKWIATQYTAFDSTETSRQALAHSSYSSRPFSIPSHLAFGIAWFVRREIQRSNSPDQDPRPRRDDANAKKIGGRPSADVGILISGCRCTQATTDSKPLQTTACRVATNYKMQDGSYTAGGRYTHGDATATLPLGPEIM
jgi:hypothetical protein